MVCYNLAIIFPFKKSPFKITRPGDFFLMVFPDFCRSKIFNQKMKRIIIKGILDENWKNSFEEMDFFYEDGNTVMVGKIKDEAHLHGILNLIRDLNLKLISVNPVD